MYQVRLITAVSLVDFATLNHYQSRAKVWVAQKLCTAQMVDSCYCSPRNAEQYTVGNNLVVGAAGMVAHDVSS